MCRRNLNHRAPVFDLNSFERIPGGSECITPPLKTYNVSYINFPLSEGANFYHNFSTDGRFNYRAHFYAPAKPLMNGQFATFWIKFVVIWFITIVLYVAL